MCPSSGNGLGRMLISGIISAFQDLVMLQELCCTLFYTFQDLFDNGKVSASYDPRSSRFLLSVLFKTFAVILYATNRFAYGKLNLNTVLFRFHSTTTIVGRMVIYL